jgi:hypothetical protein
VRSPRLASTLGTVAAIVIVAAAGSLLTACGGGTTGSSPARSPNSTATVSPAAAQNPGSPGPGSPGPDSPGPDSPRYGSAAVAASCVLGVYDESQNEFYALSGLAHGSDMATGDPVAEAYQLTMANGTGSKTATVNGFTVAVYASGKRLATTSEHLSASRLIPAGQSMTFTEYPWGTSADGRGPSVGPFARGSNGAVNTAATCRLLRWNSR